MKKLDAITNLSRSNITDVAWYLIGTVFPILINVVRSPIFTRHFSPEEYGYYSLVFLTYNYLSIALFSWLSSNIWRYYYEYKKKQRLTGFFSNIGFLYVVGSVFIVIFTAIWLGFAEHALMRKLIIFSFLYYLIQDLIGISLISIRLENRTIEYNLIQIIRAALNFSILLLLTFVFNSRIEAIPLSFFLGGLLIFIFLFFKHYKTISTLGLRFTHISKSTLKKILTYGGVGLISSLCLMILVNSDRYILALFKDINVVGIYNQNYAIAQIAILAVTTAFFNIINSSLQRELF